MKKYILIINLLIISICTSGSNANIDYIKYHKSIILAEQKIFLENKSDEGLEIFKQVFTQFDFVFIDDCIEATQIALFYKKTEFALIFLKKAIQNGFEVRKIKDLDLGCTCNFLAEKKIKADILINFYLKNKKILDQYQKNEFENHLKKINSKLLYRIIETHLLDELYKNNNKSKFENIIESNAEFIYNLFKSKIFVGEQNLGLPSDTLISRLFKPFTSVKCILDTIKKKNRAVDYTNVFIVDEYDYFHHSPLFITLYHSDNMFNYLKPFSYEAIKSGYLHPREYVYLNRLLQKELQLQPMKEMKMKNEKVNILREEYFLPSIQIDSAKHSFAHLNHLKLNFGFFYATK